MWLMKRFLVFASTPLVFEKAPGIHAADPIPSRTYWQTDRKNQQEVIKEGRRRIKAKGPEKARGRGHSKTKAARPRGRKGQPVRKGEKRGREDDSADPNEKARCSTTRLRQCFSESREEHSKD